MPSLPLLTRRRWAWLCAVAPGLAMGAGPAAPVAAKGEDERIRIAVGARSTLYHLPLLVAEGLGLFQAEVLQVEILDHAGGSLAVQALASGAADVCCGAYEHVVRHQLHGRDWRSLVVLARTPQVALVAHPRHGSGAALARLPGLRVGVTAPGSSTHYLASLWLREAGVSLARAQFVAVGNGSAAVEALRSARVHAVCHADPVLTLLEQRAGARVLADARSLKDSEQLYGGPMPGGCLFAPQGFVQRRPQQTQALVQAMVAALRWLQTASPADLARVVPKGYLLGDRSAYLMAFEKVRETLSPDGVMPAEGPATALRTVVRGESLAQPPRVLLEKTFSNSWALRARQRLERV